MLHASAAAGLEHADETDQVAFHVGKRVGERIANARLCREMQHRRRPFVGKNLPDRLLIRDVELDETKTRAGSELREARLFQAYVVVAVQVVQADDLIAAREQLQRAMHADEPGRAGQQDLHAAAPRFTSWCRWKSA